MPSRRYQRIDQLLHAAGAGDLTTVRRLLRRGMHANDESRNGETALCRAASCGQFEVVRFLLKRGASLNSIDGESVLVCAAGSGNVKLLQFLLQRGARINAAHPGDRTALMAAASRGHLEAVRFLVEQGAELNAATSRGHTALIEATRWRRGAEVVACLLELGAEITHEDDEGETALTHALNRRAWHALPEPDSEYMQSALQELEELNRVVELLVAAHPDGEAAVDAWKTKREEYEHNLQWCFIRFFYRIADYKGEQLYAEVVEPFIPYARDNLAELEKYRSLNTPENPYEVDDWESSWWYPLSRSNDALLMGLQAGSDLDWDGPFQSKEYLYWRRKGNTSRMCNWHGPGITRDEYVRFFEAIGFQPFGVLPFSPFFYEIVEVVEDESLADQVVVEHVYWPGLMFGELLFSRAGVRVRCSSSVLRKEVAERSRLHWCFWRRRRETEDGSRGSGSCSQWNTRMRRDYLHAGRFHYNVDGELDLREIDADENENYLTAAERIEMLTHRCAVTRAGMGDAYFGRDECYSEPANSPGPP